MQARAENFQSFNDSFVPISMAFVLHAALVLSLIVTFSFSRPDRIETPLAISATLIAEETYIPPPVEQPVEEPPVVEPTPAPEPEPVVDTSEQDRIAAEAAKREEDARIERERQAELDRQAEAARQERLAREKAEAEAETERRRVEAERLRQEEIERQRAENERLRLEAEAAARQEELDAELARTQAATANAQAAYQYAIKQRIKNNWVVPASVQSDLLCEVDIRQMAGGQVVSVNIGSCNGDSLVRRSIEAAVQRASPLPSPADPSVFSADIRLVFRPEDAS